MSPPGHPSAMPGRARGFEKIRRAAITGLAVSRARALLVEPLRQARRRSRMHIHYAAGARIVPVEPARK
jgi:hypothetical protein